MIQVSSLHPVFKTDSGESPLLAYLDDKNCERTVMISSMYHQENVVPSEKCDSILAKLIYSQAQFKAAEENAQSTQ